MREGPDGQFSNISNFQLWFVFSHLLSDFLMVRIVNSIENNGPWIVHDIEPGGL